VKDDRLYLIHIKECIERVIMYTEEGKDVFFADTKTQDAVMRNLQILAESTQRLSDSLKEKHPEMDWRNISGFRNVVVHEYLSIDVKRIWDIVEQDLPVLQEQIEAILRELDQL
jgi:uncharacterized protein with HEPN domain